MGKKKKAGSKKKRLESQKVKLKVGRRLTQSNMTSTVFKSGKIVVPEQIAAHRALEPLASSQAGRENDGVLEELMRDNVNKLTHCHSVARHKAVAWLRKTLNRRSDFVAERLHDLLQRVVLLLRDSDGVVRQSARQFLTLLVSKVSDAQFEPHWPLLAQHLLCIFTQSADANLHSECLNFLRSCAQSRPRAVASHCTAVFQALVARLTEMPAVTLVGYLSHNVGDGSLASIARNLCHGGEKAEPFVERLAKILKVCNDVGMKLLEEKAVAKKTGGCSVDDESDDDDDDASFGFRPRQKFAAPAPSRPETVENHDSNRLITFSEKINELHRLIGVLNKLNAKR